MTSSEQPHSSIAVPIEGPEWAGRDEARLAALAKSDMRSAITSGSKQSFGVGAMVANLHYEMQRAGGCERRIVSLGERAERLTRLVMGFGMPPADCRTGTDAAEGC